MKRQRPQFAKRRVARQRLIKGDSRLGASAVEFAIVANVLFIMILACMEFARMNMVRNLSQDAAYFGARAAIVPGATSADAVDEVERIMGSLLSNGYNVSVSELDDDSPDITVTVSVDLHEVALFAPYFLPDAVVDTTVRMGTERYAGFYDQ